MWSQFSGATMRARAGGDNESGRGARPGLASCSFYFVEGFDIAPIATRTLGAFTSGTFRTSIDSTSRSTCIHVSRFSISLPVAESRNPPLHGGTGGETTNRWWAPASTSPSHPGSAPCLPEIGRVALLRDRHIVHDRTKEAGTGADGRDARARRCEWREPRTGTTRRRRVSEGSLDPPIDLHPRATLVVARSPAPGQLEGVIRNGSAEASARRMMAWPKSFSAIP